MLNNRNKVNTMSKFRELVEKILKESYYDIVPLKDEKGRFQKGQKVSIETDYDFSDPEEGVVVGYENDDFDPSSFNYIIKSSDGKTHLVSKEKVWLPIDSMESVEND